MRAPFICPRPQALPEAMTHVLYRYHFARDTCCIVRPDEAAGQGLRAAIMGLVPPRHQSCTKPGLMALCALRQIVVPHHGRGFVRPSLVGQGRSHPAAFRAGTAKRGKKS